MIIQSSEKGLDVDVNLQPYYSTENPTASILRTMQQCTAVQSAKLCHNNNALLNRTVMHGAEVRTCNSDNVVLNDQATDRDKN